MLADDAAERKRQEEFLMSTRKQLLLLGLRYS